MAFLAIATILATTTAEAKIVVAATPHARQIDDMPPLQKLRVI